MSSTDRAFFWIVGVPVLIFMAIMYATPTPPVNQQAETSPAKYKYRNAEGQTDHQIRTTEYQVSECWSKAVSEPVSAETMEVFSKDRIHQFRFRLCMDRNGYRQNKQCMATFDENETRYLEDCWIEVKGPEKKS